MARALPIPAGASRDDMAWGEGGSGYVTPESIAKKMFAEKEAVNLKTKLTWNKDQEARLYSTDRMIGKVNLSAPYIKVGTYQYGKFYYIQNCQFFLGNGEPATIEEIEAAETAFNPVYAPEIINSLLKAEDIFLRDAAKRDDALCKICVHYRSKTHEDYLRHVMTEHPDHAMKISGIEPAAPKTETVKVTGVNGLSCCGKEFKDYRALGAHKRFAKTEHGA